MTQRVLIIHVPSLLRKIITDALESDDRTEVIECDPGEDDEEVDLMRAIEQHQPDAIVTTPGEQVYGPALDEFLAKEPCRRVLAIERVGRSAYVFSMHPEPLSLGEMSMDVLVKAIHGDFDKH